MHITAPYTSQFGVSLESAIIRVPAVALSHINPNGELDPEVLYLGFQYDVYAQEGSPAMESRYTTIVYDESVAPMRQAYGHLKELYGGVLYE